MSENTEGDFDPFDNAAQEAQTAEATPEDVVGEVDLGGDEVDPDDLFADADFSEEETAEAIEVYESGKAYESPLDVGIKEKMWVPVRLQNVSFEEKHKPRLSSKICVAVGVGASGKRQTVVAYDKMEEAIRNGFEEKLVEMDLPYILAEANHVAPEFGQRRFPYEIEVPGLTIKTALFPERTTGRKGYKNDAGPSLRKAAGVTQPGEAVNLKTLPEIASRLEGQIVMAQVTLRTKDKPRPRLNADGSPVTVLVDLHSGAPLTVYRTEAQATSENQEPVYLLNDGSGQVWDGNPKLLVPIGGSDNVYAVRDSGEQSAPLMDLYSQTTDYLKPKFLPVPERNIEVEMQDGSIAKGQITWDTVGAITKDKTPGVPVDVFLMNGDQAGQRITAIWFGTQWNERPAPKKAGEDSGRDTDQTGGGLDEFAGAKTL
jgi:hypothetical protein